MTWTHVRTALFAGAIALPAGTLYAQNTGMDQSDRHQHSSQQAQISTGTQSRIQAGSAQADRQTQRQLVEMLRMANQGEVELAQFAQQQAQNQQVKQFAQRMQQDHSQIVQQLQQITAGGAQAMSGGATGATGEASASGGATAGQNTQRFSDRDPSTGAGSDLAEASRAGMSGRADTTPGAVGESVGEQAANADAAASEVYGMAAGGQGAMPQIMQELHRQHMQSTRQWLSQQQGTEFDKAYMGHQIIQHQMMLDKLQVFGRYMPQEAQQVLQQGQQTTQEHLQEAQQIMQQLDQQG